MADINGPLLIIAGSYEEFRHWMRKRGLAPEDGKFAVYCTGVNRTRGRTFRGVRRIGTWWKQDDDVSWKVREIQEMGTVIGNG